MKLWNIKNLQPPPIVSCKIETSSVEISSLRNVLSEGVNIFQNQKQFNKEVAFLSRFIYCMKIKLRQNKSFKCLEKIEQASLRYLYIDISKTLQVFFDMIPENFATSTYLPTRSMLQYILVRLQSIGHLMIRILETSKIAATLINQNINLGHLWKILFVGYGIISRIYALSKIIAEDSCKLYSQLLPFIKNLQDTSFVWLPHNYIFPYNLKSFLNFDWTDENILIENKTLCASGYISLLNSNLESDEEWLDNDLENKTQTQIKIKNQQVVKEDLGILVNNEKRGHSKKSQLVGNIHSLQDLKVFGRKFKAHPEKYTNNFKKIDRIQCNMLQNTISKYIRLLHKCSLDTFKTNQYLETVKNCLNCL